MYWKKARKNIEISSRYSSGMRTFALTLKSSARQLGMMGMVLSTGVVFFSTLLYFVEKDEKDTPFTSIPAAFWWAIVTMTTVGYGDYVPVTVRKYFFQFSLKDVLNIDFSWKTDCKWSNYQWSIGTCSSYHYHRWQLYESFWKVSNCALYFYIW